MFEGRVRGIGCQGLADLGSMLANLEAVAAGTPTSCKGFLSKEAPKGYYSTGYHLGFRV